MHFKYSFNFLKKNNHIGEMLNWNKKRLELMGLSGLIDGPTTQEELKDLCSDRWRLPHKPCDEVYNRVFLGGE